MLTGSTQPRTARLLAAFILATLLALSAACGGREDDQSNTPNTATPGSQPRDTGAPRGTEPAPNDHVFTRDEAANIASLVKQQRAAGKLPPKFTRIQPEEGYDTIDLPASFPVDIPLPDTATPQSHISSKQDGTMTVAVVADSVESAFGFYLHELEAEGWSVDDSGSVSDLTMLNASKGDRMLAVAITTVEGETKVTLIESGGVE